MEKTGLRAGVFPTVFYINTVARPFPPTILILENAGCTTGFPLSIDRLAALPAHPVAGVLQVHAGRGEGIPDSVCGREVFPFPGVVSERDD